jgi:hypothetical protein
MRHRNLKFLWTIFVYAPQKYFCGAHTLGVPLNTFLPIMVFLVVNNSLSVLVEILDNGELAKEPTFFLITGLVAILGEKCGLVGKSIPFRIVEGMRTFFETSLTFPMMRNK